MSDSSYRETLLSALAKDRSFRNWKVEPVRDPEPGKADVLVIDAAALDRLAGPLPNPERVVLITTNEPRQLARAWKARIQSVIYEREALSIAMLAILAARDRALKCTA